VTSSKAQPRQYSLAVTNPPPSALEVIPLFLKHSNFTKSVSYFQTQVFHNRICSLPVLYMSTTWTPINKPVTDPFNKPAKVPVKMPPKAKAEVSAKSAPTKTDETSAPKVAKAGGAPAQKAGKAGKAEKVVDDELKLSKFCPSRRS
jgi:hypothetical protein